MLTYHGTQKTQLTTLSPQYYGGSNGSQDGIGINTTDDLTLAQNYATPDGRLLLVYLQTERFLAVNEKQPLSAAQCATLDALFETLPIPLQMRLATDINGKQVTRFNYEDEEKALSFFKKERDALKSLNLPDRLQPFNDFEKTHVDIHTARRQWDLSQTNTAHLHYVLNLYDNAFATDVLKTICDGLILDKPSGQCNYLSFRANETVLADFAVAQTQTPAFESLLGDLSQYPPKQWVNLMSQGLSPSEIGECLFTQMPEPSLTPKTPELTPDAAPENTVTQRPKPN